MTDETVESEVASNGDFAAPAATTATISYPKVTQFVDDDASIVHYAPKAHILPNEANRT